MTVLGFRSKIELKILRFLEALDLPGVSNNENKKKLQKNVKI